MTCRPDLPHLAPCGDHPSGDSFFCACGCDGADGWCYQREIDRLRDAGTLYHPDSEYRTRWVTCPECFKERQVGHRDFPKTAEMFLSIAEHTLCHACSDDFARERDTCPETVSWEQGVSACRLHYRHLGRCQPYDFGSEDNWQGGIDLNLYGRIGDPSDAVCEVCMKHVDSNVVPCGHYNAILFRRHDV